MATTTPKASSKDEAFLALAKKRFKQSQNANQKQLEREIADIKMYNGEQWSAEAEKNRKGQDAANGMPPIPARPCYVVNKLREPVRQVLNQERQSDMGIQLVAADDFASLVGPLDDTEVELREGLARRIQRSSEAADARTWAFSRATIAGTGTYAVMVRFLPGKTWNKEVYVHRFYNQACVSLDPAHEQPDGSDAEWAFVGADMPWEQYKAEFPHSTAKPNDVSRATDDEFRAFGDEYPDWFTIDGETRSCRVVDYWYTERTNRTLVLLSDGESAWRDELPSDVPDGVIVDERDVVQKQIKWAKLDGSQVLDETDWEGPDLPIVKVLGEELQPYDKERRSEGIVRPARHSQEGFNAMVSKGVEEVGLSPIPPFQATPEQIEGFEAWYQAANTRALPYLPYNGVAIGGQPLNPPTRTPAGTDLTAIFASMQMFDEAVQSTTGVPEARVGRNTARRDQSGKALQEQRESSEQGTSNYIDNLKRSIRYEGQIINNLLYPIYGKTPGRIVRIMTGEGDSETVRIGPAPQDGQPQQGKPPKEYKLTKDADFNVIVKVSRASDSRRAEESNVLGELFGAQPQLITWFGDIFFKNQDWAGHKEMAERAKLMLAPPIQQMLQQKEQGTEIPPEVQQQMAMMQAKLKEAESIMQQLHQELETKRLDNDTKVKIAQMDADKAFKLQEMKDATEIAKAHIAAAAKGADMEAHAAEEAKALGEREDKQADRELALQMHREKLSSAEGIAQLNVQAKRDTAAQAARSKRSVQFTRGEDGSVQSATIAGDHDDEGPE
jgi:hypothetical protein